MDCLTKCKSCCGEYSREHIVKHGGYCSDCCVIGVPWRDARIKELEMSNKGLSDIINGINDQYQTLVGAVRSVVTQRADDLCFMDAYLTLGVLVGVEVSPEDFAMLPNEKFLANCKRFCESLKTGRDYERDYATERIKELEAENSELKAMCRSLNAF